MDRVNLSRVLPWNTFPDSADLLDQIPVPIDGLWIVIFTRGEGTPVNGTAVFLDGLILGGDNERCYIGDYLQTQVGIEGKINLPCHTTINEPSPFFGSANEPVVSFSLEREQEGKFPYVGNGEIQNPVNAVANFTIALQRAYRLD